MSQRVITLDYNDLINDVDLTNEIEEAYGHAGLGLLTVSNVPGFVEKRQRLLSLAKTFARLPEDVKNKYVSEKTDYSFGWSHGVEALERGRYDTFKGSYYNNPQYNRPTEDEKLIQECPHAYSPNIWPNEDLPELETAFMELGQLIVQVGLLVARQCDKYARSRFSVYGEHQLFDLISNSKTCKARLLHYFPIKGKDEPRTRDSWCTWHNDHGSLTGLCSAMFMRDDDSTDEIDNPDPEAGLYARTRANVEVKVNIPKTHIAFQIGESSQILTGGLLKATPHAVQAVSHPLSESVSRETFAVFMQPNTDVVLSQPEGTPANEVAIGRWVPGQTFKQFHEATLAMTSRYK